MPADGDQTKARLLGAARDLYLEEGFARFSLREVARRVGVSAAAVYRHYDGKEALLREVCAAGFRIFSSYLLRALSGATPRERMALCAEQYLRFGLENPRDYRVIFMGGAEEYAAVTASAKTSGKTMVEGDSTFQFLVDRVRECIQERILRREDPQTLATVIWAHVHGLVSLRLSGHLGAVGDDAAFARFYEQSTGRLLAAMAP
jgi:AcrR family transcriptional regulator